jgi:ribosomal protein L37E
MSDPAPAPSDGYSLTPPDPDVIKSSQLIEPMQMAVPETAHLSCARCGYNLTGLTSRRCPECGTPFSYLSARRILRTGREPAEDSRVALIANIKLVLGGVALTFAIAAPWATATNSFEYIGALIVTWVNLLILAFGLKYLIASTMTLAEWLFRMGLLLAALVALVLWIM